MYSSLVDNYVNHWRKFLVEHSLGLEWLNGYPVPSPKVTEPVPARDLDKPLDGDKDEDEPDSETPNDPDFEEMFADLHSQ